MYLKREKRKTGPTIIAQFNQKFKRNSNQSNKNFNKKSNKMPFGHKTIILHYTINSPTDDNFNPNNLKNNFNYNYAFQ